MGPRGLHRHTTQPGPGRRSKGRTLSMHRESLARGMPAGNAGVPLEGSKGRRPVRVEGDRSPTARRIRECSAARVTVDGAVLPRQYVIVKLIFALQWKAPGLRGRPEGSGAWCRDLLPPAPKTGLTGSFSVFRRMIRTSKPRSCPFWIGALAPKAT